MTYEISLDQKYVLASELVKNLACQVDTFDISDDLEFLKKPKECIAEATKLIIEEKIIPFSKIKMRSLDLGRIIAVEMEIKLVDLTPDAFIDLFSSSSPLELIYGIENENINSKPETQWAKDKYKIIFDVHNLIVFHLGFLSGKIRKVNVLLYCYKDSVKKAEII